MFCVKCGKENTSGAFCIYCGAPLHPVQRPVQQVAPMPMPFGQQQQSLQQPFQQPVQQPVQQVAPMPMPFGQQQPVQKKRKKFVLPLVVVMVLLMVFAAGFFVFRYLKSQGKNEPLTAGSRWSGNMEIVSITGIENPEDIRYNVTGQISDQPAGRVLTVVHSEFTGETTRLLDLYIEKDEDVFSLDPHGPSVFSETRFTDEALSVPEISYQKGLMTIAFRYDNGNVSYECTFRMAKIPEEQ